MQDQATVVFVSGESGVGKSAPCEAFLHELGSEGPMFAAAARRRLGELIGGDEGRALLAEGDAVMRAQRVVNLDAVTEMLCAGCRAP